MNNRINTVILVVFQSDKKWMIGISRNLRINTMSVDIKESEMIIGSYQIYVIFYWDYY